MKVSSGFKTLVVLLVTFIAGGCSSWLAAAAFDSNYGPAWIPAVLGILVCAVQAIIMERMPTEGDMMRVEVFKREMAKQELRTEVHVQRLAKLKAQTPKSNEKDETP